MASFCGYVKNVLCVSNLGNIIDKVLAEEGTQVGKVLTYKVGGTRLAKKMPILFKGIENPHLKFGYEGENQFFVNVMDGQNPVRRINYKKVNGVYHADMSSPTENLNCIFDPAKDLYRPARSAVKVQTGNPEENVDLLLNLNDSALRAESSIRRSRLGRLGQTLPNNTTVELASGVEGVKQGKSRVRVEYHDSKANVEFKNSTIKRLLSGIFD